MSCKLFFAGDVVLADNCFNENLFSNELLNEINKCDIVCCNFEAPVNIELKPKKKVGPNNSNSNRIPALLASNGFNLITLANNHIFDFGIDGIKKTCDVFNNLNIDTIGAGICKEKIYEPYIKNINGYEIGIINVAENGFGAAIENEEYGFAYIFHDRTKENIKILREKCDLVIAVCHAGAEHWNIPLPEWRKTYKEMIDLGIDIVIGHHPHVQQGWEKYKDGMIYYSIGNFAFNKGKGVQDPEAYAVVISIDNDKRFECDIIPTIFDDGVVRKDNDENRIKYLNNCCNILKDENEYINKVNEKCLETYGNYKNAYGRIVCIYNGNLKEKIKGLIKKYILGIKFQDIWLYHNIAIETHYYICRRIARLKLKNNNIL